MFGIRTRARQSVFASGEEARRLEIRRAEVEVDLAGIVEQVVIQVVPQETRHEMDVLVRHLQFIGMPVVREAAETTLDDGASVARDVVGGVQPRHDRVPGAEVDPIPALRRIHGLERRSDAERHCSGMKPTACAKRAPRLSVSRRFSVQLSWPNAQKVCVKSFGTQSGEPSL
jgi:hypothetical protein